MSERIEDIVFVRVENEPLEARTIQNCDVILLINTIWELRQKLNPSDFSPVLMKFLEKHIQESAK